MTDQPTLADPEVAAATFDEHLRDFFRNGRPAREPGWTYFYLDSLTAIVITPARRDTGAIDPYFVQLGAAYYDRWPPSVTFVEPGPISTWVEALANSMWWPKIEGAPFSFGAHNPYTYPSGRHGQLLCYSHTLEYYLSNHGPTDEERWKQGRHKLTATLSRLADVLTAPYYKGRASG